MDVEPRFFQQRSLPAVPGTENFHKAADLPEALRQALEICAFTGLDVQIQQLRHIGVPASGKTC